MRTISELLVTILIILIILFIIQSVIIAWALGIGWILTRLFEFNLFEGTVLGLVSLFMLGIIIQQFLVEMFRPASGLDVDEFEEEEYFEDKYDIIPLSRFYKTSKDKTWESWVRYMLSNGIYTEFQESSKPVALMGEKQLQELAIRLSDIGISSMKKISSMGAKKLKVTKSNLENQMKKMGQMPYDDDILQLAVSVINDELTDEDTVEVVKYKLWEEPCDLFE